MRDFLAVDDAIVIRVERGEESGHRALHATRLRAFAARAAFAAGRLVGTLRRLWLIVLRKERTRGKRERQRGRESAVSFHGFLGCD
jgi:hypothetical protein